MERDFKGVWIPKEIWLSKDLSVLDKVLLAEIDSLDNKNHCIASNDYFAEFFNVSIPTITRSIKKLKELNLIHTEMVNSNSGSYRIIKMIKGSNQNDETGLIKMINNYNSNNNSNSKVLSKDNTTQPEFDFGVSENKPKKQNLYQKCVSCIYDFTDNSNLQTVLIRYLDFVLEKYRNENKTLYANQWKGLLKKLDSINNKIASVEYSIQKGYIGFYEVDTNFSNNVDYIHLGAKKTETKQVGTLVTNLDGSLKTF